MIDLKNYIKETIKSVDSDIDTGDGSVVHDFLISPLLPILEKYEREQTDIVDKLSLKDLSNFSNEELDAVAANFLVSRNTGNKAIGKIRIYFSQPKALTISKGSKFFVNNLIFETIYDYAITKSGMERNNTEFPNYTTGDIQVISVSSGEEYNLPAQTVFKPMFTLQFTPVKIVNVHAFEEGTSTENNQQFVDRLKNSIINQSLASPHGIRAKIDSLIAGIDVEVIGAGHPMMLRDLSNTFEDIENYHEEDFSHVYRNQHSGTYDKKHIAYSDNFTNTSEEGNFTFPNVSDWVNEFSNEQYTGIFTVDDAGYAETKETWIVKEEFTNVTKLHLLIDGWKFNDGKNLSGRLYYDDEIRTNNTSIILGQTQTDSPVIIPRGIAEHLVTLLREVSHE